MGVDTKGIIPGVVNPIDILVFLTDLRDNTREDIVPGCRNRTTNASLHVTTMNGFPNIYHINFGWRTFDPAISNNRFAPKLIGDPESRMLFICNNACDYTEVFPGVKTILSLGYWGSSVEIMRHVVGRFGGYILAADTGDDWKMMPMPA